MTRFTTPIRHLAGACAVLGLCPNIALLPGDAVHRTRMVLPGGVEEGILLDPTLLSRTFVPRLPRHRIPAGIGADAMVENTHVQMSAPSFGTGGPAGVDRDAAVRPAGPSWPGCPPPTLRAPLAECRHAAHGHQGRGHRH